MTTKITTLENYDGRKAYFGSERYSIYGINGKKYAFPSDIGVMQDISEAVGKKRRRLEEKFPVFQIVVESLDNAEARAIKVNSQRNDLLKKLLTGE